jgi:hypothetical protein
MLWLLLLVAASPVVYRLLVTTPLGQAVSKKRDVELRLDGHLTALPIPSPAAPSIKLYTPASLKRIMILLAIVGFGATLPFHWVYNIPDHDGLTTMRVFPKDHLTFYHTFVDMNEISGLELLSDLSLVAGLNR